MLDLHSSWSDIHLQPRVLMLDVTLYRTTSRAVAAELLLAVDLVSRLHHEDLGNALVVLDRVENRFLLLWVRTL